MMGFRAGWIARAFFATLFGSIVSACGARPNTVTERIQTFFPNPSNKVVRIRLIVPLDPVSAMKATYYMKTNHGTTTRWKPALSVHSDGSTVVTVIPDGKNTGPKADDGVIAYYYDPHTGELNVSPPALVLPYSASQPPTSIFDQEFSMWTGVYPDLSPLGWNVTSTARASFDIRPFTWNNYGIRLSVASTPIQEAGVIATPIPNRTASVALSQSTTITRSHLNVEMRPFQPCVIRNGQVIAATGIQVSSESGRSELFCIGTSPYDGPATIDGSKVEATVVRGHIGDWNDTSFNLRSVLHSEKTMAVVLSVVAYLDPAKATRRWITMDVTSVQSAR